MHSVAAGRSRAAYTSRLALREMQCIEDAPLKWGACGKQVKTCRAFVWREAQPHESEQMALW